MAQGNVLKTAVFPEFSQGKGGDEDQCQEHAKSLPVGVEAIVPQPVPLRHPWGKEIFSLFCRRRRRKFSLRRRRRENFIFGLVLLGFFRFGSFKLLSVSFISLLFGIPMDSHWIPNGFPLDSQ